jgi:hypothetical protein
MSALTWDKLVKHIRDMDLKLPSNESLINEFRFFNRRPVFEHEPKREPMTRFQTFAYGTPVLKPDPRIHIGVDMGSSSGDISVATINGLRIFYSEHIMDRTGPRLFPESRHRSKRILKKLIKRFSGEFELAPAIVKSGNVFYVHPHFKEELEGSVSL